MNALKIGIIDDELIIAESILVSLQSLGYLVPEPAGSYEDALRLIETEKPDLVLLDINLKGLKDGVDIAKIINAKYHIPFIFITAHTETPIVKYARETFPSSYLIKPFQKENLYTAIEMAISNHNSKIKTDEPGDYIFIKDGAKVFKVRFDDILYLESDHVYVSVITKSKKKFLVRTSLQQYVEFFDKKIFCRISRSHVININNIEGFYSWYVVITDKQLPIGKNYRDEMLKKTRFSQPKSF